MPTIASHNLELFSADCPSHTNRNDDDVLIFLKEKDNQTRPKSIVISQRPWRKGHIRQDETLIKLKKIPER